MSIGDAVLYRLAVPGGWHWMRAVIVAAHPDAWRTRRYDLRVDGRIVHRVSELSLRPIERRPA